MTRPNITRRQSAPFVHASGLTLIELSVTMAIVVIVLALGIAGLRSLVAHNRLANASNSLIAHLVYARSEAIALSANLIVCPSSDGATCLTSAGTLWNQGYIVRIEGGDVQRRVAAAEMQGISVSKSGSTTKVTFRPDGSVNVPCTFTVCDAGDSANKRAVIVSRVGRSRIADHAPGGAALSCP